MKLSQPGPLEYPGRNMDASCFGKWLIFAGIGIAMLGMLVWLTGKTGVPFGRLPGDISIEGKGYSFRFPIVTCIVLSILLTVILNIVIHIIRR